MENKKKLRKINETDQKPPKTNEQKHEKSMKGWEPVSFQLCILVGGGAAPRKTMKN